MRPTWLLILAGFLAGTAFGALALGGHFGASEAESGPVLAAEPGPDPLALAARLYEATATATAIGQEQPAAIEGPAEPPAPEAAWQSSLASLASGLETLQRRVARLEQQLSAALPAASGETADEERPEPPRTSEARHGALVAAGVDAALAEEILWQEDQRTLDRLALRDQATREGWVGTARFREAMREIGADAASLREQIGDAAYDRYLYRTGVDNRVQVTAVIPGSAAEAAGLQPGDLIESYAEAPLFGFRELRARTTEGEPGELVPVRVRRGGALVEAWIPRGPMGITLETSRAEPLP